MTDSVLFISTLTKSIQHLQLVLVGPWVQNCFFLHCSHCWKSTPHCTWSTPDWSHRKVCCNIITTMKKNEKKHKTKRPQFRPCPGHLFGQWDLHPLPAACPAALAVPPLWGSRGAPEAQRALSSYLAQKNKTYKSPFRFILLWKRTARHFIISY